MDRQFAHVLIPNRNSGGADKNSGVIGKGKSEDERCCLPCIFHDTQWQRRSVSFGQKSREGSGRGGARKTKQRPHAHRHRAVRLEHTQHVQKAGGTPQVGDQQCQRNYCSSRSNPARVTNQFAVSTGIVGDRTHYCCGSSSATSKKIKRHLPGPRRLFQQWDTVVTSLRGCLGEGRAGRTNPDRFHFTTALSFVTNFE